MPQTLDVSSIVAATPTVFPASPLDSTLVPPTLVVDAQFRARAANGAFAALLADSVALPAQLADVLDPDRLGQLVPAVRAALDGRPQAAVLPLRRDGDPTTLVAAPLGHDPAGTQLVSVREATPDAAASAAAGARPELFVRTLGHTRVLRGGAEVRGAWLEQLPGQLLKLLVTFRDQMVPVEQIAEALWPGGGASVLASVRFTVHQLRKRIDVPGDCPSLVISHRGGYRLDGARTRCDADVFADLVAPGLAAAAAGAHTVARADLETAVSLYRGDYVGDEPYAEWVFPERERLREIAGRALAALADICEREDALEAAARHLERLTRLEPYDEDAQRRLIEVCLARGRRSEAMRRYAMLEGLLRRDLDTRPSFALRDLLAAQAAALGGPQSAAVAR